MRFVDRSLEQLLLSHDVFDSSPYGLLIVDRAGRMMACNGAFENLTGSERLTGSEVTCCTLFGCGAASGSLPGRCLTELALDAGGALPELRVQLPWAAPADAVWVTVAPLGGRGRLLVHVRPGNRRPHRALTAAQATPRLRVYTLGRCRVDRADGPLDDAWLSQRAGHLFKFLIVERHRVVPTEEIADTLWPDRGLRALGNVRHFVHTLRASLEPDRERGASSFIVGFPGGYTIDRRRVTIDADEFVVEAEKSTSEVTAGRTAPALASLQRAAKLYRGEFLEDELYADWTFAERNRLRRLAAAVFATLGKLKRAEGDLEGAAIAFERLAALEPFDMDVQRRLLAVLLELGRRSEALRRYSALRVRMLRAFGEDPGFRLVDLAESVSPQA